MPADRPAIARKVTTKTESTRKAAIDAVETSIKVDGITYTVRLADVDGLFDRDCRRETGLSVMGVLTQMANDPGMDSLAAFVWIAKSQQGLKTTYQDELALYSWDTEIVYGAEEPAPAPEA